jgi:acetyl esterase
MAATATPSLSGGIRPARISPRRPSSRARSGPWPVLCYGIYDFHRALPLVASLVGGPGAADQQYVEPDAFEALADDPRLNPERRCEALPRTLILAGDRDPLYVESAALADRLGTTSVPFDFVTVKDAPHGVLQLPGHPGHRDALRSIQSFLRHIEVAAVPS